MRSLANVVALVALVLVSACGASSEPAAIDTAQKLAAAVDGATAEAVEEGHWLAKAAFDGKDDAPSSAAVVVLPPETCEPNLDRCFGLVTVETDLDKAKSIAGFSKALAPADHIEFNGPTQLHIKGVADPITVGILLGEFGGEAP